MRRKQRAETEDFARQLLSCAEVFHLATTTPEGAPVLRVLNGVLVRDWVLFHGAFAGEKSDCLGQPGVVSVHETVADIPSHFVDEQKACPATTYYRSAQARGTLQDVADGALKVEMLSALMEKYQPEGGHEPFTSPIYEKDLRSVRVIGLEITGLSAKVSLGQDRPAERTQMVVRGLWQRGKARDLPAIELVLDASPEARLPSWSKRVNDEQLTIHVHPDEQMVAEHAELLVGQYWRRGSTPEEMRAAIRQSTAWVGVCRPSGQLLAAGRASSDGHWVASLFDVVVKEEFRGRGLGKWLMETLLDHPCVRRTKWQKLGTKDAQGFYQAFGFHEGAAAGLDFQPTAMTRARRER